MNLRQQVLSDTDQLRQQLLQAVDRLVFNKHQEQMLMSIINSVHLQPHQLLPQHNQFLYQQQHSLCLILFLYSLPLYAQPCLPILSLPLNNHLLLPLSNLPVLIPGHCLRLPLCNLPALIPGHCLPILSLTLTSSYHRSLLPSATQQPYTPMSQSSTPESLLQQQTSSLFCTDPR